jgi:hypothetical protein
MNYCGSCGGGYSGGAGYSASPQSSYSSLEHAVSNYSNSVSVNHSRQETIFVEDIPRKTYAKKAGNYSSGLYLSSKYEPSFAPSGFLTDILTEHVSSDNNIMPYVRQAFEATTGNEFPSDIKIKVMKEEEMKEMHEQNHGFWDKGIQGFCLNRKGFGTSYIFVKENRLAELMLTIGHEIGHVMSLSLENSRDEESKAFAFSIAWMDAIVKSNIAGLSSAINPRPAKNGLHNVAFGFVMDLIKSGRKAIDVYMELAKKMISIESLLPEY